MAVWLTYQECTKVTGDEAVTLIQRAEDLYGDEWEPGQGVYDGRR